MSRRKRAERAVPELGHHHGGDFGTYMAHKQAKLRYQMADYG